MPNYRAAFDAGRAVCFDFWRHRPSLARLDPSIEPYCAS